METSHASVFVLVPKTAGGESFSFVRDVKRERVQELRKLPGGGVEEERAVDFAEKAADLGIRSVKITSSEIVVRVSGSAEVYEEIGLCIEPPRRRLVEVHERNKEGDGAHHWFALLALPPVSSRLLRRKESEKAEMERAWLAAGEERRIVLRQEIHRVESEIDAVRAEWPLENGEEIAESGWLSREDMFASVKRGEFFMNHAQANRWYLSGGWDAARRAIECGKSEVGDFSRLSEEETDKAWEKIFDAAEDDPAVKSVLAEMPFKRGMIDKYICGDGCLIICYDQECEVCEHSDETVDAALGVPAPVEPASPPRAADQARTFFPLGISSGNGRVPGFTFKFGSGSVTKNPSARPPKPQPVSPADAMVSGEVEVMLLWSDRFEDRILLARDFRVSDPDRYQNVVKPHMVKCDGSVSISSFLESLNAKALDPKSKDYVPVASIAERHVTLSREGGAVVLLAVGAKTRLLRLGLGGGREYVNLVSFSVNGPPPSGFIVGFMQAQTIADALARFRSTHGLEVHPEWIRLPKEIQRKERERDAEARRTFESALASA